MNWSPQQDAALREVAEWLQDSTRQIFRLFGFAGTGKTTLARHLAADVDGPTLFAAYTGKAASVLRQRGCEGACTLHSLLYSVRDADKSELRRMEQELKDMPANHRDRAELEAEIKFERERVKRPRFSLNEDSVIRDASLVVLDECSMVNAHIAHDLMSFKKKILVLGDPAQLPPVKGGGFFTDARPDRLLTEIHRQALDNPIVRWSKKVREGDVLPFADEGAARKLPAGKLEVVPLAISGAQLLTGKNATRRELNQKVRRAMGHRSQYPLTGERLVILKNDRELGVLNGVTCTTMCDAVCDDVDEDAATVHLMYEGTPLYNVDLDATIFRGEEANPTGYLPADYGYALTVHKAQGSQWKHVVLVDDGFGKREPDMRRRWLYTAITRAEEQLTIVV